MKKIALAIVGIIAALLGLLWFLQGADLVHIKPLLCFANCQPVTGKSLTWQITGAIMFIVGIFIIYKNIKKHND
ncbi:MAG: hypothetical protein WC472_01885 [Candidatus Paceibacterota bacterium]